MGGGVDSSGQVTTECSLKMQTLYSGKHRKHSEYRERGLKQSRESYLEVVFDIIYASSSADVSVEEYPANFLKFMNTNFGKEYILTDLRSIDIAVADVDDISSLEVNSVTTTRITESPTPAPTVSHSIVPSSSSVAPSSSPESTPSSGPAFFPSLSPTQYPTRVPTRVPTRKPSRKPSPRPSKKPTRRPTRRPTKQPIRCRTWLEKIVSGTNDIISGTHDFFFGHW